ncbi:ferrous iron transport protein B [Mesosutterella sp. OilRF-GAM-744-9]|uniref:Ferrous iron transport protein B n=1 Tax=Mesosutterella porci TaxID=2915351 RepID=A0ABS9MQA7_9BURK|nr:ferrous iron transport protein B [Mesosutterella sp. oilRF-744-WT-GAM-9]MCG5030791.1 ferrous iron transport protein B [Mesosutterella sp. oilRF-744-WT-GAM-9]
MNLRELPVGKAATVTTVGGEGALRQHFLDMGLIPGVEVVLVKYAPMGDPMELLVQGYSLTLRVADAEKIGIEGVRNEPRAAQEDADDEDLSLVPHPALGEEHSFQENYEEEHASPLEGKLTFALVGNQNCGKTTLFNQLTGSNQHVGNFPGVTVDRKSGFIKGHPEFEVTDLPGIYSLSPYTSEEIISREFILREKPSAIINIVDATNIERNLYLTMQLMELGVPVVLALNMMDEMEGNGGTIHINEMESILQIPVVPISAKKGQGIDELVRHAVHIARYHELPGRTDFCGRDDHGGAVHRCIHGIMHLVEDHARAAGIPVRFAAGKLIEGDPIVERDLKLEQNEKDMIGHIVQQMESERGLDRAAAMADMRFLFIRRLCARTVVKPRHSREHERSQKIDRILTGRFTAIPAFVAIMAVVFWLTFSVIGAFLQDELAEGIDWFTQRASEALEASGVNEAMKSLLVDAVMNGVGSVVSFIPIIVVLFFFLSMLEDSGYMARVAFVMDKLLRKIGLSGRSVVPLLIGFGCTVPAVMSTRTLPSERDRRFTILLTPFMSCSAKMPIYAFFTAAFFPRHGGLVMVSLYLIGIFSGILVALVSKRFRAEGEAVPFVMELPNYRLPGLQNTLRLMWDKAKDFLQRAFTVIFVGTIVVWFLQSFDFTLNMVQNSEDSILASAAGAIAPIFAPLGFGDWRVSTSLISGFLAKESVVSTLSVLYGSVPSLRASLTPLAAFSLLIFCLLYTPCIAAIASVKRELGGKSALELVFFQCAFAWAAAFLVYGVGRLAGLG